MSGEERLALMRAAALRLVIGVVVVDVVGALLFKFTPIADTERGRTIGVAVWILITFAVVLPPLKTIRGLRRRG